MNEESRKEILLIISSCFAGGKTNSEIIDILRNVKTLMILGYAIKEEDFIDLIRHLLEMKPGEHYICSSCERKSESEYEEGEGEEKFKCDDEEFNLRLVTFPNSYCYPERTTSIEMTPASLNLAKEIALIGIKAKEPIAAIKKLREQFHWSLQEAKHFLDSVRDKTLTVEKVRKII